jgi:hypothetical protein
LQELNKERAEFEREVLSKNEKIADLKERLQEKKSGWDVLCKTPLLSSSLLMGSTWRCML